MDLSERFWRWLRDFSERRIYRGHLVWCGGTDHPNDLNTRYWIGRNHDSDFYFCTLACRRKAGL